MAVDKPFDSLYMGDNTMKVRKTWSTNYHCMIIGSYGDEGAYSTNIWPRVVCKRSSRSAFLQEVGRDVESIQDMILEDPHTSLGYVIDVFPGNSYTASQCLSKIERFLQKCKTSNYREGRYCTSCTLIRTVSDTLIM